MYSAVYTNGCVFVCVCVCVCVCSENVTKVLFPQVAVQILQKPVVDIRCASRAWKVNLIGEGADDAGGVFDETMAHMCEV